LYKTTATDERKIYDNFLVDRLVLKTMTAASPKAQIRRQSRISNALGTTRSTQACRKRGARYVDAITL
jgi:hypothetical protein